MEYEFTEEGKVMSPENKNWNSEICTIYASWGHQHEGTLRSLVKQNYPAAKKLSDLVEKTDHFDVKDKMKNQESKSVQTTERIYTFPVPIPSALARESVCWGEDEIKAITRGTGEEIWAHK